MSFSSLTSRPPDSRPAAAKRESLRDWLWRRSPAALALAALIGVTCVCLVVGALFPLSPHSATGIGEVYAVLALVMAVGTLVFAPRLPSTVLLGEATVAVLLNSILVADARTRVGAMGDAICYFWLTIYVAAFFSRATRWFMCLAVLGFTAALLKTGLPRMESAWFLICITTVASGLIVEQISRRSRAQMETDPLTGVLNRSGLNEAATRIRSGPHRRGDVEMSLVVLDLDGFKQVNDSSGHAAGDRLLAETAAAWRQQLRRDDILARIGGDEFVMLLPGTSLEQAHELLERLRSHSPAQWSAGITSWPVGEHLEETMLRADRLLYMDKARD